MRNVRELAGYRRRVEYRPGLHPAVAEVRRAVRVALADWIAAASGGAAPVRPAAHPPPQHVLIALSGGADSLALAAAAAREAPRLGLTATAIVVDHGLQPGAAAVATTAAAQAERLGLAAEVHRVTVHGTDEAAARQARYRAFARAAASHRATGILLGHTLDDQAESVLLGLARGSGAASLHGMAARTERDGLTLIRPLLGTRRATTRAACQAEHLTPWHDPHNTDPRFARVRVRERVLPALEAELGPGVAEALARTATGLREDTEAFDQIIHETIEDIVEHAEAGIQVSVSALAANPAALRHRIIRTVVQAEFGQSLSRVQTVEVARLVTDWSGQGPIALPGCTARRIAGAIVFAARDEPS